MKGLNNHELRRWGLRAFVRHHCDMLLRWPKITWWASWEKGGCGCQRRYGNQNWKVFRRSWRRKQPKVKAYAPHIYLQIVLWLASRGYSPPDVPQTCLHSRSRATIHTIPFRWLQIPINRQRVMLIPAGGKSSKPPGHAVSHCSPLSQASTTRSSFKELPKFKETMWMWSMVYEPRDSLASFHLVVLGRIKLA